MSVCLFVCLSVCLSHPSNLLLDRLTGKVLHIDFGDCWEVAQQRQKHPEKIPFRLTRMLAEASAAPALSLLPPARVRACAEF